MDNKRGFAGVNIGLASIVVMFVVIALTIFAALSLSTSAQEKKLANKYAESVKNYWAADSECAELANAFGALWESSAAESEIEKLASDSGAELYRDSGDIFVSYERPIGDTSALTVTLRLGQEFGVVTWRMVPADPDWTPDDTIPVFKG